MHNSGAKLERAPPAAPSTPQRGSRGPCSDRTGRDPRQGARDLVPPRAYDASRLPLRDGSNVPTTLHRQELRPIEHAPIVGRNLAVNVAPTEFGSRTNAQSRRFVADSNSVTLRLALELTRAEQ